MPSKPRPPRKQSAHALLTSLFRELFQTERSAKVHPAREARHLGEVPPAEALRAVASHAAATLEELPAIARANRLPVSRAGQALGALFSLVRESIADRLLEAERSYRGTLLGMRHGVDLVKMIRLVADHHGMVEIGGFCTRWLEAREPLVARAEQALAWFAQHPHVATQGAARSTPAQRAEEAHGVA